MIKKHCVIYEKQGGRPEPIHIIEKEQWLKRGYVETLEEVQNVKIDMVIDRLQNLIGKTDLTSAPYYMLSERLQEGMALMLKKIEDIPDYQGGELWKSTGFKMGM